MASYDWRFEMENMLAAFNRQAIHSLGLIQLGFKQNGLSFTPEFKKFFMHASTNRLSGAYDQFQINVMFEEKLSSSLNSVANVSDRSASNGSNDVECESDDGENYTSIEDGSDWTTNALNSVVQTEPTQPDTAAVKNGAALIVNPHEIESDTIFTQNTSDTYKSNDGPIATDDLHKTDELIPHQLNESFIIAPEVGNDSKIAVKMDESDDLIKMIEIQRDSTDADDDKTIPSNVVLSHLDETAIAEWDEDKRKTMPLNRKNAHKKRMMKMEETNDDRDNVATKGEKLTPKQLAPKNQIRCTVCGCASYLKNFSRHMRTHTGEKPYGCNRCGKRFSRSASLMKHAATHIAEFPFHCRACFQGFSLKTEAVAHEKQCRQRHYECHLCKKFVSCSKNELIIHMRTHTGDKPFRCEICMRCFAQKQNLKQHLNIIHSKIDF